MEISTTCKICGKEFKSVGGLRNHLTRIEKQDFGSYLKENYPKYDKWNGDLITLDAAGSLDKYIERDFLNKENFQKWLFRKADREEAIGYCLNLIKERKEKKSLEFSPCQVELRSIFSPSLLSLSSLFLDGMKQYQEACSGLGLKERFDYSQCPKPPYIEDFKIFVDTREQQPLSLDCESEILGLNVGDYTCAPPHYADVFIERKSLSDFVGTMSDYERFEKEILRAQAMGAYLVGVVESPLDACLSFKAPKRSKQRFGGVGAFARLRQILQDHDNIQFLFVKDRKESAEKVRQILSLGERVRKIDLQFCYDKKEL